MYYIYLKQVLEKDVLFYKKKDISIKAQETCEITKTLLHNEKKSFRKEDLWFHATSYEMRSISKNAIKGFHL